MTQQQKKIMLFAAFSFSNSTLFFFLLLCFINTLVLSLWFLPFFFFFFVKVSNCSPFSRTSRLMSCVLSSGLRTELASVNLMPCGVITSRMALQFVGGVKFANGLSAEHPLDAPIYGRAVLCLLSGTARRLTAVGYVFLFDVTWGDGTADRCCTCFPHVHAFPQLFHLFRDGNTFVNFKFFQTNAPANYVCRP